MMLVQRAVRTRAAPRAVLAVVVTTLIGAACGAPDAASPATPPPVPTVAEQAAAHALAHLVLDAFEGSVYPGDDNLTTLAEPAENDFECKELAQSFRGRTWKSVMPIDVRANADALPLFNAAAFRYYLPAYMLACVNAPEAVGSACDNIVYALTPDTPELAALEAEQHEEIKRHAPWWLRGMVGAAENLVPKLDETQRAARMAWWHERVDGFTPAQVGAILAWLRAAQAEEAAVYGKAGISVPPHLGVAVPYWTSQAAPKSASP